MGLVNELQESAEKEDVISVLRKAKRVAYKLNQLGIVEWIEREMNGYPEGAEVPEYRNIPVSFHYDTNGYIPMGYGQIANGVMPIKNFNPNIDIPIGEPISTLVEWSTDIDKNPGNCIFQAVSGRQRRTLLDVLKSNDPDFLNRVTFMTKLDSPSIRAVQDRVKDKILDWACRLESAGVSGNSHSFSEKEKYSGSNTVFQISGSKINQVTSVNDSHGNDLSAANNENVSGKFFFSLHPVISSITAIVGVLFTWLGLHYQYDLWFFGF